MKELSIVVKQSQANDGRSRSKHLNDEVSVADIILRLAIMTSSSSGGTRDDYDRQATLFDHDEIDESL